MKFREDFIKKRAQISVPGQIKIIILTVLTILLFGPAFYVLLNTWSTNSDYSHGFFVLPIALFMVWRRRDEFISAEQVHSWGWFPLFFLSILMYVISIITNFHTLANVFILLVILSLLLFIAGHKIVKAAFLPILFLIFMFPIPNSYYILITNPLKLMITSVSAVVIGFFNIPVFQEGNLLFFADTQLEVAEACSGIRSLYTYIMLGCLIALICDKLSSKLVLILSTIPLAIIVNIIRVSGTGILANYYGPEVAQGFFHEFTGFILFIIGFIVLFALYCMLERSFKCGIR